MELTRVQDKASRQATLSLVLKLLRRRAGLRSGEAARAMNTALRSYQRFEAGTFGLDLDRIFRFADVVDADPWGIVFAVEFGSPEFALRTASNKAASLLLLALRRFDRQAGADLAALDPRSLLTGYTRAFAQLSDRAREFDAYVEQWMFDPGLTGLFDDDDD